LAQAPVVIDQPTSIEGPAGTTFTFVVTAYSDDGGTLSYEWFFFNTVEWLAVQGATEPLLAIPVSVPGIYILYVAITNTNAYGQENTIISDFAILTVYELESETQETATETEEPEPTPSPTPPSWW
jgi:hypothetical protein